MLGGIHATALQPKAGRSMTCGGRRVNRWCGEIVASAVEEPTEEMVVLCQSTAYEMIHGQWRGEAEESIRIAVAVSAMRPMIRSAMGFKGK